MRSCFPNIAILILCSFCAQVFSEIDNSNYQSVVSIRNRTDDLHICNGVLIGNNWVLTLASCVNNFSSSDIYVYHSNAVASNNQEESIIAEDINVKLGAELADQNEDQPEVQPRNQPEDPPEDQPEGQPEIRVFVSDAPEVALDDTHRYYINDDSAGVVSKEDYNIEEDQTPIKKVSMGVNERDIFGPKVETRQRFLDDDLPRYPLVPKKNSGEELIESVGRTTTATSENADDESAFMRWRRNFNVRKEEDKDSTETEVARDSSLDENSEEEEGIAFRKKRDVSMSVDKYDIAQIRIHPNFNKMVFNFDIAMIQINVPEDKLEDMQPVYLNLDLDTELGPDYNAYGYGITSDQDDTYVEKLQTIPMQAVQSYVCNESFVGMFDEEDHVCMQSQAAQPCRGFAGTPIIKNGLLYGILAYMTSCDRTSPLIAVKVSEYVRYIQVEHSMSYRISHDDDNAYLFQLFSKFTRALKD